MISRLSLEMSGSRTPWLSENYCNVLNGWNDWNKSVAGTGYGFSMPMENIRSKSWRE